MKCRAGLHERTRPGRCMECKAIRDREAYERTRPWAAETRLEFGTSAENVAEALAALNATIAAEKDYAAQVEAEALALVEAEPDQLADRYVNPNRWEPEVPWMGEGACVGVDPNIFYPEGLEGTTRQDQGRLAADTRRAREVCWTCQVREECRDWAISHGEEYGIWGGLTPSERDKRRQLRIAS